MASIANPSDFVILEGAYSSAPQLADLVDFAAMLEVPAAELLHRRTIRDGEAFLNEWVPIWEEVEQYYFSTVRPPESFDLVIGNPDS